MRTVMGAAGTGRDVPDATFPFTPGGIVCPTPVTVKVTVEPMAAGFALELAVPSSLSTTAWPYPEPSTVKMAGEEVAAGRATEDVWRPSRATTTLVAGRPAIWYGTKAVICPVATNSSGAAMPSNRTWVPANAVGYCPPASGLASIVSAGPNWRPDKVTAEPGLTAEYRRLAAFRTSLADSVKGWAKTA